MSTAPKACTVMDTNCDISEPYQTIVIVEDNIDSSSVDANVIPANCQEPDSDRSAPSTLTSVHVNWSSPLAPPEDRRQHWQQPHQQSDGYGCADKSHGCGGGEDAEPEDCAACASDVTFLVGRDKQLMLGRKSSMASVSDFFRGMFFGPWREYRQEIAVPEFSTRAFAVLLR